MKLLFRSNINSEQFDKGCVASIGNFDGVHIGHQSLIHELRNRARQLNLPLVLIIFEPQPKEYFQPEGSLTRLSSLRDKLGYLAEASVDYVYCIKFNRVLAQTSAIDFINTHIIKHLNVRYLLVGEDFKFGKNREGTIALLQEYCASYACTVDVYPNHLLNQERISSTTIRQALQKGDLHHAEALLGHTYCVSGRVIRGDGRGRQWGIPTANVGLRHCLPLKGVFIVRVRIGTKTVFGVANVGVRPTVDGTKNSLEVHLFDFCDSIYGQRVHVFFLHKIRDEVKFVSVDTLLEQIHRDIAVGRAFLNAVTPI
jgi:riboflavin kinase/FMN adenylyltransferase